METEIEVSEISKTYKKGPAALKGINLIIKKGCFFVLLGPNGAGKSTLTRVITSLSPPDSGRVTVCGLNPVKESRELQKLIGVALQENDLDPVVSVREHLLFQARLFGMSGREARTRTDELLQSFPPESTPAFFIASFSS